MLAACQRVHAKSLSGIPYESMFDPVWPGGPNSLEFAYMKGLHFEPACELIYIHSPSHFRETVHKFKNDSVVLLRHRVVNM